MELSVTLKNKYEKLKAYIESLENVAVAFSAGVDSTFLLKVCHDILRENVLALTVRAECIPEWEIQEAVRFCEAESVAHKICDVNQMAIEGFSSNPPNRCYLCKNELFASMWRQARKENIQVLLDGSNVDDDGDYRPGMKALAEQNVISPLKQVGLTKEEIRILSRMLGLLTWEKPSYACLASRFVYGELITEDKIRMVDQSEQFLRMLGFRQVRVRLHGNLARIEMTQEDMELLHRDSIKNQIVQQLKAFGFVYVCLDLQGYRTGSMNETLS